jgi:hypothetical protein
MYLTTKIFCKFWIAERNVKKSWMMGFGYAYTIRFMSFEYSIALTNIK